MLANVANLANRVANPDGGIFAAVSNPVPRLEHLRYWVRLIALTNAAKVTEKNDFEDGRVDLTQLNAVVTIARENYLDMIPPEPKAS